MKHDKTLAWLLDEEWIPKEVSIHTNEIGMPNEEFDDFWSKSMGYDNINDMNNHNYRRDKEIYLKYGDRTQGLI